MSISSYRTTLGTTAVTYGVHNATTGAQTAAPVAATLLATNDRERIYLSGDITLPAHAYWYEDGVLIDIDDKMGIGDASGNVTAGNMVAEAPSLITLESAAIAIQDRTDNLPDDPASQQAVIDAFDGNVTGDTRIDQATRIDASGNIVADPLGTALGIASPGSTMELYPEIAGVVDYSQAERRTTATGSGTWALHAGAGTWELVVSKSGSWDEANGDSVITRRIVIA